MAVELFQSNVIVPLPTWNSVLADVKVSITKPIAHFEKVLEVQSDSMMGSCVAN